MQKETNLMGQSELPGLVKMKSRTVEVQDLYLIMGPILGEINKMDCDSYIFNNINKKFNIYNIYFK